MNRFWKTLFAVSGVLVLLGCLDSPVLLPYPLFVLAYFRNWHLPIKGKPFVRLVLSTYLSTLLLESGAWLSEFIKNSPDPALFHPQLVPDLIMGIGFYAAWWLTWGLVLRKYRFTVSQVFITTGPDDVIVHVAVPSTDAPSATMRASRPRRAASSASMTWSSVAQLLACSPSSMSTGTGCAPAGSGGRATGCALRPFQRPSRRRTGCSWQNRKNTEGSDRVCMFDRLYL